MFASDFPDDWKEYDHFELMVKEILKNNRCFHFEKRTKVGRRFGFISFIVIQDIHHVSLWIGVRKIKAASAQSHGNKEVRKYTKKQLNFSVKSGNLRDHRDFTEVVKNQKLEKDQITC